MAEIPIEKLLNNLPDQVVEVEDLNKCPLKDTCPLIEDCPTTWTHIEVSFPYLCNVKELKRMYLNYYEKQRNRSSERL